MELSDRILLLFNKLVNFHPILKKLEQGEYFQMLRRLAGEPDSAGSAEAALYIRLAYRRKSLIYLATARIDCVWDLLERLSPPERILIFGERISQAEELYRLLQRRYPGKTGIYHPKLGMQANKNTLDRFCTGEIRILITCKALDEGVDIPDAATGIILSGTSTQRQRVQRLDRILHPAYDPAANRLLQDMKDAGTEEKKITEAGRCLKLGSVRADFMLEQNLIDRHIREAVSIRERNYWFCMKKLRKYLPEE